MSVIICIGAIYAGKRGSTNDKLVEQIINMQKGKGELDEEAVESVVIKIEKSDANIDANQAFIMGYKKYVAGDYALAKTYLERAYAGRDEGIRLYATVFLTQILCEQDLYSEAIAITQETLEALSGNMYNKEHPTIVSLMQQIIHLENGKTAMMKSLENILQAEYKLNMEVMCDLKNKLGVLYFYNGNYARGIERFLEVMAHTEGMENKYYGAKAQIDLGVIYGALGNYDEAKTNFKQALEVEIVNLEDQAFIKTYAFINLYENMLYEEDYQGVVEISEQVSSYTQYLPENLYDSITIMNEIFLCNYQIKLGEIQKAEILLKEIAHKLKAPEDYRYLSVHANYTLLKAGFYSATGEVKKAQGLYESVLETEEQQFKKYSLKNLIEMFNTYGYCEESNSYAVQLTNYYEEEAAKMNMDYYKYALDKYESEKNLMVEANRKVYIYMYKVIGGLIILVGLIFSGIKYRKLININKLDGLTKIYNRRYFDEYYANLQHKDNPFAIMILDIDHFKVINDTYGHLVGDKVIKCVVECSKNIIGDKGKIFRYGGEEFVVILEAPHEEEALITAEAIRSAVEGYGWQQEELVVTVSIGMTQTMHMQRDILNKADQNLYMAKEQGRNQVVYK